MVWTTLLRSAVWRVTEKLAASKKALQTSYNLLPDDELEAMGSMADMAAARSARSSVEDDATVFPASTTKHANGIRENSLSRLMLLLPIDIGKLTSSRTLPNLSGYADQ